MDIKIESMRKDQEIALIMQLQQNVNPLDLKFDLEWKMYLVIVSQQQEANLTEKLGLKKIRAC
jgi:hypothetical protein